MSVLAHGFNPDQQFSYPVANPNALVPFGARWVPHWFAMMGVADLGVGPIVAAAGAEALGGALIDWGLGGLSAPSLVDLHHYSDQLLTSLTISTYSQYTHTTSLTSSLTSSASVLTNNPPCKRCADAVAAGEDVTCEGPSGKTCSRCSARKRKCNCKP